MKSISRIAGRTATLSLVRSAVLYQLQSLTQGELIIEQGDERFQFGQAQPGMPSARVTIESDHAFRLVLLNGALGAAEAFVLGRWHSEQLRQVIRIFALNRSVVQGMNRGIAGLCKPVARVAHWLNRNNQQGSRRNIAAHYDLGNALFKLFLDPSLMYSSAIYAQEQMTLAQAQQYRLQVICEKLQLCEQDHIIEIGCGWGGFALYAAQQYRCKVTATTLSAQQYEYTQQAVIQAGLADRITVLQQDYRLLQGQYDKLVSIEMIEAVGHAYYGQYFKQCSDLLRPNGIALIQAITIQDQAYAYYRKNVDFIQKYIFPGGHLPCMTQMMIALTKHTDMRLGHMEDITRHYERTLQDWRQAFLSQRSRIQALGYDEYFIRLWQYYFCYCEGGFAEHTIQAVQLLLVKPLYRT